jgi:hypothetical protein
MDIAALKQAAEAAKGWDWETVRDDRFGHENEDGVFYEIATVDADQYAMDADSNFNETVLSYLVKVPPAKVLELIASHERLVEALSDLAEVAAPNIYPQPDKPRAAWTKLQAARAALAAAGQ